MRSAPAPVTRNTKAALTTKRVSTQARSRAHPSSIHTPPEAKAGIVMAPGEILVLIRLDDLTELQEGHSAVHHIQHMDCERVDQSEPLGRRRRRWRRQRKLRLKGVWQAH